MAKEVFVKNCSSESSRVKRITFGDAKMGMHKNTKSRKIFAEGAIECAKFLYKKKPGMYFVEDLF